MCLGEVLCCCISVLCCCLYQGKRYGGRHVDRHHDWQKWSAPSGDASWLWHGSSGPMFLCPEHPSFRSTPAERCTVCLGHLFDMLPTQQPDRCEKGNSTRENPGLTGSKRNAATCGPRRALGPWGTRVDDALATRGRTRATADNSPRSSSSRESRRWPTVVFSVALRPRDRPGQIYLGWAGHHESGQSADGVEGERSPGRKGV